MSQQNNIFAPKYIYDNPMFMITVSTIVVYENGVFLTKDDSKCTDQTIFYKFPSGVVRAGQESIQFAAVRHIKEQLGIVIKKDSLIPVDFRSEPERSESGNIVDIGFVTILEDNKCSKGKWFEVNFENKEIIFSEINALSSDNSILLQRALDIILMVKN